MSNFRASSHAEEDLKSIFRYTIRKWDFDQADTYLKLLSFARERIVANPFLRGSKPREDLVAVCRSFRCGKHIFFYRLRNKTVEIARILTNPWISNGTSPNPISHKIPSLFL
jgi:toxin ParE1/3/4